MRQALNMCLNWRALLVLAGVAVAVIVFAPGAALAILPLLLLAACPLSMGLMLFMMRGHGAGASESCHHTESHAPIEGKQARLAAVREEEQRLVDELAPRPVHASDAEVATPATLPASRAQT